MIEEDQQQLSQTRPIYLSGWEPHVEHYWVDTLPPQKMETWPRHAPKIGLVGAGTFGILIARALAQHCDLMVFDLSESALKGAEALGARRVSLEECAASDVVVLAVPVPKLEEVASRIGQYLRPGALVCDVASVKLAPLKVLAAHVPENVEIMGTHPLFGPQSAPGSLHGQTIVLCPIRTARLRLVKRALSGELGLNVIVMTPEDHDRAMATVQGITHLIGRIIRRMPAIDEALATKSFKLLLESSDLVAQDSNDLYDTIQKVNPFSASVRERFFQIANSVQLELSQRSCSNEMCKITPRTTSTDYGQ